ncbi:MAG: hypothetical protein IPL75_12765 [Acidobacteria bacterium]|jgi:hypothetical protein|nr:hypothetical protein [Acidobacteriota bacterium]
MTLFNRFQSLDAPFAFVGMLAVGYLSLSGQYVIIGRDTLATLASSCDPGDRPEWNGKAWECEPRGLAPLKRSGPGTVFEAGSEAEPSTAKYAMTVVDHPFESPFPYIDKTMQLGYNSKDGLRNSSTEAAVYLQFESKYQLNNSPDPGQKVYETHLTGVDTKGVEHRHYSNASAWDGSFGITSIAATTLNFMNWNDVLLAQLLDREFAANVPLVNATDANVKFQVTNADRSATNFRIADSGNSMRHALTIDAGTRDALNITNTDGNSTHLTIRSGASNANFAQLVQDATATGDFAIVTGVPAAAIKMLTGTAGFKVQTPTFGAALEVTDDGVTRARGGLEVTGAVYSGSTSGPSWTSGAGSPEGVLAAPVGSMYSRTDGGPGTTLYVKEQGTGNTGWVAK